MKRFGETAHAVTYDMDKHERTADLLADFEQLEEVWGSVWR